MNKDELQHLLIKLEEKLKPLFEKRTQDEADALISKLQTVKGGAFGTLRINDMPNYLSYWEVTIWAMDEMVDSSVRIEVGYDDYHCKLISDETLCPILSINAIKKKILELDKLALKFIDIDCIERNKEMK